MRRSKDPKITKAPSLSLALQARMRELELQPRDLASEIDHAYDHVRKVLNGDVFPGLDFLKDICAGLNLDFREMHQLLEQDRALDKGIEYAFTGMNPVLSQIDRFMKHMDADAIDRVLRIVEMEAQSCIKKGTEAGRSSVTSGFPYGSYAEATA